MGRNQTNFYSSEIIITNLKKVVKAIEKKEREERTKQLNEAAHALNSLSLKDKSPAELYKSIIKGLNEEQTQKSNSDEVRGSLGLPACLCACQLCDHV